MVDRRGRGFNHLRPPAIWTWSAIRR